MWQRLLFCVIHYCIFDSVSHILCIYINRKDSPIAYLGIKRRDGPFLNGFTVQLITHGLQKGSLWNT